MATQRRIRRLVVGALFLCLTICTLVVKQYIFALLLGSVTYWLILSGIFEAFSDEPDPETGRPAMSKAWVLAGLAFFIAIAGLFAWLSPVRGQTHKTAEDIQLKVDRSGDPDAGLHQQYVSELVTPDDEAEAKTDELQQPVDRSREYVLNTNTNVFHLPECSYVGSILDENKEVYTGTRDSVADMGYEPCGHCNP
jgi:hypothetical protein